MRYLYNERNESSSKGFNLVELMVAMSIVSIFAAVALPAMRTFYQATAVRAETGDLLAALYFARGEAIKRRTIVSVCPSVDYRHCNPAATAADWRNGWIVRTEEKVLRVKERVQEQIRVSDGSLAIIRYEPNGVSNLKSTASLNVCGRNSDVGRQVKITRTGRPYSTDVTCSTA